MRLNPQALGLNDTVLLMVTLNSHSDNTLEKFGEQLATIPEVVEAHLVSGTYDYLLRVMVKDTRTTSACCAKNSTKSKAFSTASRCLCCAPSSVPRCLWGCSAPVNRASSVG